MIKNIKEIIQYRDLLWMLIIRDIRIRYKQAAMGFLWAIFMPIVAISAGIIIKKAMAVVSGQYFDEKVIVSITFKVLPWTFFVSSIRFAVQSLVGNGVLLTKIYFPRAVLPFASTAACFFDLCMASLVIPVLILIFKIEVSLVFLWLPLILLFVVLFTLGVGLILSATNLFYRDVKYIVEIILMFGIFFTPVFYEAHSMGNLKNLILLNPIGALLDSIYHVTGLLQAPDLLWLMYGGATSLIVFFFGFYVFSRLEPNFAENV